MAICSVCVAYPIAEDQGYSDCVTVYEVASASADRVNHSTVRDHWPVGVTRLEKRGFTSDLNRVTSADTVYSDAGKVNVTLAY